MKKIDRLFLLGIAMLGTSSCSFGQTIEKLVRFRTTDNRYILATSGGKFLGLSRASDDSRQIFTLIDLNGSELSEGDLINVKYTPGVPAGGGIPSPPNYWRSNTGDLTRGAEPDAFKVKKLEGLYVFQATDGQFVAAPTNGKSLTLTKAEQDALKVQVLDASIQAPQAPPQTVSQTPAQNNLEEARKKALQLADEWFATNWKPKSKPTSVNGTSITSFGAVGDGTTLNTEKIQKAIDQTAAKGGGTVVIPKGTFLSSSIFLKPGVNLHLEEGAVLKGSANIADYPRVRTRIEGHFEENFVPALLNANNCDHLRITGSGTLDGNGETYWKEFYARYKANRRTKNLDVPRPRLALIENSDDVQISGVTFKDSGFWTLHLYRCTNVLVENSRFEVPKDNSIKSPSTDGIDIDSSQHVTVRSCTFRVDDDCIAIKGSKGPFALDDKDSPPVEHIRIENCIFERGHGVLTVGSEATLVRNVVVENCLVTGKIALVRLKLRPDTPQHYEDIHYRDITLTGTEPSYSASIFEVLPWTQYFDLKGQPRPKSVVKNVTLSNVKGVFGSFGDIRGNRNQTDISDILIQNIDVQLQNTQLNVGDIKNLKIENVRVNGEPFSLKSEGS